METPAEQVSFNSLFEQSLLNRLFKKTVLKDSCKKTAKVGRMFSTGEAEKERQNKGGCSI